MTKSPFASKTFWFGILQMAFGVTGLVTGWLDVQAASSLIITGAGTIGFRFMTTTPIM